MNGERGRDRTATRAGAFRDRFTRRRLLRLTTIGTLSAVAGCLGGSDRRPSADGDDGEERVPYNAADASIDDHPITEPVPFGDSHRCPVCNMQPIDYRNWGCQLAHADATGLFFESPGCLLAYRAVTRSHPTDSSIERVWFVDFETLDFFDAAEGYLVEETDLDAQLGPMSGSPVPFATRDRAAAYVEDAPHLDETAIITIGDVDDDLAAFYRGDRMPTT